MLEEAGPAAPFSCPSLLGPAASAAASLAACSLRVNLRNNQEGVIHMGCTCITAVSTIRWTFSMPCILLLWLKFLANPPLTNSFRLYYKNESAICMLDYAKGIEAILVDAAPFRLSLGALELSDELFHILSHEIWHFAAQGALHVICSQPCPQLYLQFDTKDVCQLEGLLHLLFQSRQGYTTFKQRMWMIVEKRPDTSDGKD